MRQIQSSTKKMKLPDMRILKRYSVHPHAYGFCPKCGMYWDYWKYGLLDYSCPGGCGTLEQLDPVQLAAALRSCEEGGCFAEDILTPTPLMPLSNDINWFKYGGK